MAITSGRHWSPAEIALLSRGQLADGEIAERTGRSVSAVAAQRRRLAQKRAMRLGLYPYRRTTPDPTKHPFAALRYLPQPR